MYFFLVAVWSAAGCGRGPSRASSGGKKPRRRVASVAQRRAANIRERRRMFNLNEAFDKLRRKVKKCHPDFNRSILYSWHAIRTLTVKEPTNMQIPISRSQRSRMKNVCRGSRRSDWPSPTSASCASCYTDRRSRTITRPCNDTSSTPKSRGVLRCRHQHSSRKMSTVRQCSKTFHCYGWKRFAFTRSSFETFLMTKSS